MEVQRELARRESHDLDEDPLVRTLMYQLFEASLHVSAEPASLVVCHASVSLAQTIASQTESVRCNAMLMRIPHAALCVFRASIARRRGCDCEWSAASEREVCCRCDDCHGKPVCLMLIE